MLDLIRESNLIEGIDDHDEDMQSLVAWGYLSMQQSLNHSVIRKTQKLITLHQKGLLPHQKGYYRDLSKAEVRVGKHIAPASGLVKGLMDNWLLDYKSLTPQEAHIRFEKIHPFVDGNGRTGRMLMWWHELKLGGAPTLIRSNEADRHYYYAWFR